MDKQLEKHSKWCVMIITDLTPGFATEMVSEKECSGCGIWYPHNLSSINYRDTHGAEFVAQRIGLPRLLQYMQLCKYILSAHV